MPRSPKGVPVRIAALLLLAALSARASQIFHMDLEEALGMTEVVVLARVDQVSEIPNEYAVVMEYGLEVVSVLSGADSTARGLAAVYAADRPRSLLTEDGTEVWESPLVTGSGLEMSVQRGDTVVAFLGSRLEDYPEPVRLVRMEPADSLPAVRRLLLGMGRLTRGH